MSHEISEVDGITEAVFAVEKAWHQLGQFSSTPMTGEEAMAMSHLNWPTLSAPSQVTLPDGTIVEASDRKLQYRLSKSGAPIYLGTVGAGYETVQNDRCFKLMDAITGGGRAVFTSAGALREGRRVFITAKLPEVIRVKGDDVIEQYLTLLNSHDGSGMFRVFFSPIRVVCANTEAAAVGGQDNGVSFKHVGEDLEVRIQQAEKVLSGSADYFGRAGTAFQQMAEAQVTDQEFQSYVRTLYPDVHKKEHTIDRQPMRDSITQYYNTAPGAELAIGTWWGAYNAVTYHECHGRWADSKVGLSRRFEICQTGEGRTRMERAYAIAEARALDLVGV